MPPTATRSYQLTDFVPTARQELLRLARSARVQPSFRKFSSTRWWCSVRDTRQPRHYSAAIANSPAAALQLAIQVRLHANAGSSGERDDEPDDSEC